MTPKGEKMQRFLMEELVKWKDKYNRKPLIIKGARQVGKTWLMKEFGKLHFEKCAYVSFYNNQRMKRVFEEDYDIQRIITNINIETHVEVTPGNTLIILDEIQEAPKALESLKYFCENAPEYAVIVAGSLLGVAIHAGISFPVGKVDILELHPMNFREFLLAIGEVKLEELLVKGDFALIGDFKEKYAFALKNYYYVGGMPEVVKTFVEEKDYRSVRKVQLSLLKSYNRDFSKHPPKEIVKRMALLWNTIPSQLAKENRKFVYTAIRSSARARDFETSIQWLCDAGVVYKVTRVIAGELPLAGFEDADAFKLYTLDIGLHGAMSGLDARTLISGDDFFKQYKGALTEQFILQQLQLMEETEIHYWSPDTGIAEVDFVLQSSGQIIPIEVKAEQNLRAKSLVEFIKRYAPSMVIRTSMAPYERGEKVVDLPLFAISLLPELIRGLLPRY